MSTVSDAAWFFGAQARAGRCAEGANVGLGGTHPNPIVVADEHNANIFDYDPISLVSVLISSHL